MPLCCGSSTMMRHQLMADRRSGAPARPAVFRAWPYSQPITDWDTSTTSAATRSAMLCRLWRLAPSQMTICVDEMDAWMEVLVLLGVFANGSGSWLAGHTQAPLLMWLPPHLEPA